MAIRINNTTVIDDSRNVVNAPHVDLSGSSSLFGFDTAGNKIDSWNPESSPIGRLPIFGSGNFRVYTSPGTFTVNPGVSQIRVRVVGAGGNGGTGGCGSLLTSCPGSVPVPVTNCYGVFATPGGGGGGGGYAHKVISSFPAPRTYTVTVGSAPGGTSSFGAEVSATGGSNGANGFNACCTVIVCGSCISPLYPFNLACAAGGTGTGGDVNYSGAPSCCICGTTCSRLVALWPGVPLLQSSLTSGGASGTQLGNGSGCAVPSVPCTQFGSMMVPTCQSCPCIVCEIRIGKSVYGNNIKRFPFDIFDGYNGISNVPCIAVMSTTNYMDGCDGGVGGTNLACCGGYSPRVSCSGTGAGGIYAPIYCGTPTYCRVISGGAGGIGGGGGGGGAGNTAQTSGPTFCGCPGGAGGNGLVIVEW